MIREYTHKTLTGFERLLLLMGAFLLLAFGALQMYRIVYARAMVHRFRTQVIPASANSATAGLPSGNGIPDFRLWAEKRIEAYQLSIAQNFAAPLAVLRISSIDLEVPVLEDRKSTRLNSSH